MFQGNSLDKLKENYYLTKLPDYLNEGWDCSVFTNMYDDIDGAIDDAPDELWVSCLGIGDSILRDQYKDIYEWWQDNKGFDSGIISEFTPCYHREDVIGSITFSSGSMGTIWRFTHGKGMAAKCGVYFSKLETCNTPVSEEEEVEAMKLLQGYVRRVCGYTNVGIMRGCK